MFRLCFKPKVAKEEVAEEAPKAMEADSAVPPSTTTATRQRVAELEKEVERLRIRERAAAKREGGDKFQESAFDRHHDKLSPGKKKEIKTSLKAASGVDLLFLVDCTGSMGSYIQEVKAKIDNIVSQTRGSFRRLILNVSFVGYRDFGDDENRIQTFGFSSDISAFKSYVEAVNATGGGDEPEDVFGGLDAAADQNWTQQHRIMIHIADAPCHGSMFQNSGVSDDHPLNEKGEDQNGLTAKGVLTKLKAKGIKHWFHHVRPTSTSRMIEEFNKTMKGAQYHIETVDLSGDAGKISKFVVGSLAGSVSASVAIYSGSTLPSPLLSKATLATGPPDWSKIEAENALEFIPSYPKVKKASSLKDIHKIRKQITWSQRKVKLKLSSQPFARGAMREAHYGLEMKSDGGTEKVVIKRFDARRRRQGYDTVENYTLQMKMQALSKLLADVFNSELEKVCPEAKRIQFLEARTVNMIDRTELYCANLEREISGFEKFNSNGGYVAAEGHQEAQAFSHWTYSITNGTLMVVDLQGMVKDGCYYLTDPAIHSREGSFGMTDLSMEGFGAFFESHELNSICTALGLETVDPKVFEDC